MAGEAKGKAPAFQFYAKDWLSDPPLRRCCRTTMSIWIDMLSMMWLEQERGKFVVHEEKFCGIFPSSVTERDTFLTEAAANGLCDVTRASDGRLTFICRRMHSEWKAVVSNRMRQQTYRRRHLGRRASAAVSSELGSDTSALTNSRITPPSSSASPTASSSATASASSLGFSGGGGNRQGVGFTAFGGESTPRHLPTPSQKERTGKRTSLREVMEARGLLVPAPPATPHAATGNREHTETPAAAGKGGNE